ncbi:hypothetical protein VP01_1816g2 [Puccinia sorghi]|uniref:DDE Tnp4 domain-containing protein n=1 Tax=Puccinia sorghi TaxID=27349 RepID=A0A0L6VEN6_9BASI|nr:hypothetical protein VP01_1816g2 [Puccinia sorghi]
MTKIPHPNNSTQLIHELNHASLIISTQAAPPSSNRSSQTQESIPIIYNMKSQFASCPKQEEQVELSQFMKEEGFPGCLGFVDGTEITLSQKPPIHGNHNFDRNKHYPKMGGNVCRFP